MQFGLNLKTLVVIPIILFIFSVYTLFYNYTTTGSFILRDIDLKGGTLITIETSAQVDTKFLENKLTEKYGSVLISSLKTSTGYGASIEVDVSINPNDVIKYVKSLGMNVVSFSIETIGPALGELFFQQIISVLTVAFVLMSIVIFIIYRNPVSVFAIVFSILADILTTLALTSLIGIKISFAGLAGILMLIAYGVDSNIVLTNKVLRTTPEDFNKEFKKAFITGATISVTITATMAAVSLLSMSKLLTNIADILVVGFLVDLSNTWILNSAMLQWWVNRRYKA